MPLRRAGRTSPRRGRHIGCNFFKSVDRLAPQEFPGRLSGPGEYTSHGPWLGFPAARFDRRELLAFKTRQGAITWLRVIDLACAAFSLMVAAGVATAGLDATLPDPVLHQDAATLALFLGLFVATASVFPLFALYTEAALFEWREAAKASVKAVSAVMLILIVAAAVLNPPLITPAFLATYWFLASACGIAARWMARRLLFLSEAQGITSRRTLIVGTNSRAQEIAVRMVDRPGYGYRLLGFVADSWEVPPPLNASEAYSLVSDLSGFADYVRNNVVDEVVVCLPLPCLYETASSVLAISEEQGVAVTVVTRLFELKDLRRRTGRHGGDVVVTISNSLADERERILKRFLDVSVALTALVVLSPLFLAVWALIRLTSKGPAIFVQKRVGLNKRVFRFYKFRTMVENAHELQDVLEAQNEMDGAIFKIKKDPRVTPIGRFLRKTSIDELPQLLNVLRGDMSLVGPRPLPVRDVARIEKDWPRRRFGVKPGITCLWQISGRNNVPFERMMELDIEYVDTWNVMLDIRILLRTIPVVLSMRGAY